MNINTLITKANGIVAEKHGKGISRDKLQTFVRALFKLIRTASVVEAVTIQDFGKFTVRRNAEKVIKNMFTTDHANGEFIVEAHDTPRFKPCESWKLETRFPEGIPAEKIKVKNQENV